MKKIELNASDVRRILPARKEDAHKGDFGKILLLCGSRGYTGAAALAALGALRCGAGLVYLGVPDSIYAIEAAKLTEPIVLPLPDLEGKLASTAVSDVSNLLGSMDAVLIGPGLGRSSGVDEVVYFVLRNYPGPVILDADGINSISVHMDILRERTGPTVLTPHEGEFLRLGGDLSLGRESAAAKLATDLGHVILLKGHRTLITDGSTIYINKTGNPGMAVGGSGDLLAGMITALIGQKLDVLTAAAIAAWVHGAAGDLCAEQLGQYGLLPSDMLRVLPRLLK